MRGHHFTTKEITAPFEAQFRNAPTFWREFVSCYLFAQGVAQGDGPIGIKVRDYDKNGKEIYRSARWFSKRLRDRIVAGLRNAETALEGSDAGQNPRVWEVLGYMEAEAGIGLADLDYDDSGLALVQRASDLIGIGSDVSCYRGIIY